jgi:hypothetical protein
VEIEGVSGPFHIQRTVENALPTDLSRNPEEPAELPIAVNYFKNSFGNVIGTELPNQKTRLCSLF